MTIFVANKNFKIVAERNARNRKWDPHESSVREDSISKDLTVILWNFNSKLWDLAANVIMFK